MYVYIYISYTAILNVCSLNLQVANVYIIYRELSYIQLHIYVHIYNIYTVKKDIIINKIYLELLISLLTVSRYL